MPSVFVSFVVPCYNIQEFLPRCIESLEKQSIPGQEVEFILINDGSKDNTVDLIRQFAGRDSRVTVIDQPNQGVCAARNNGLAVARGEYVFFLDGDDWLTDDACVLMYDFCKEKHPDIVLFSNHEYKEGSAANKSWYTSTDHIPPGYYGTKEYLNCTSCLPISFKLYRRAFLNEHHIVFDQNLVVGEVFTFFIHALSMSETVGVSPSYVMYYLRRRAESAMTTINAERDLTILKTLHTMNGYVANNCPQMKEKRAYLITSFWLVTAFALIKYVGKTPYRKEIGALLTQVKKDQEYRALLKFFTGKGFSSSKYTALALCIRLTPTKVAYGIIRAYYLWATRNNEK